MTPKYLQLHLFRTCNRLLRLLFSEDIVCTEALFSTRGSLSLSGSTYLSASSASTLPDV